MRLRPSGRQGPVATSLESFRAYQREEAWTWEHLALTRARPVAGEDEIGAAVEALRDEVLNAPRDIGKTIADVVEMRTRIAEAKGPRGPLDAKIGPGRMQDVELVAQCAAILAPETPRGVMEQIDQGVAIGWINADEAAALKASYGLLRPMQAAAKLLTEGTLDLEAIGQGGRDFLLRATGEASIEDLGAAVAARSRAAEEAIEAILARKPGEAAT